MRWNWPSLPGAISGWPNGFIWPQAATEHSEQEECAIHTSRCAKYHNAPLPLFRQSDGRLLRTHTPSAVSMYTGPSRPETEEEGGVRSRGLVAERNGLCQNGVVAGSGVPATWRLWPRLTAHRLGGSGAAVALVLQSARDRPCRPRSCALCWG